jgi:hypothetical protein
VIFDGMTKPVGRTLYITTEFGAGLVVTMSVIALYFWTRRGEVEFAHRIVTLGKVPSLG